MPDVLIVDSEYGSRESLRLVLSSEHAVRTAAGADEARALLARENFDLVLMDPAPLARDGPALLSFIAADYPDLPVIVVSASDDAPTVAASKRQISGDFVGKPFEVNSLRQTVRRVLESTSRRPTASACGPPPVTPPTTLTAGVSLENAVAAYERELIREALLRTDGVQTRAAALLGTTRRVIKYKMGKLGIATNGV